MIQSYNPSKYLKKPVAYVDVSALPSPLVAKDAVMRLPVHLIFHVVACGPGP